VIFGTITREDLRNIVDLSPREKAVFAPLVVLVLWMGLYPNSFLLPIRSFGRSSGAAGKCGDQGAATGRARCGLRRIAC